MGIWFAVKVTIRMWEWEKEKKHWGEKGKQMVLYSSHLYLLHIPLLYFSTAFSIKREQAMFLHVKYVGGQCLNYWIGFSLDHWLIQALAHSWPTSRTFCGFFLLAHSALHRVVYTHLSRYSFCSALCFSRISTVHISASKVFGHH